MNDNNIGAWLAYKATRKHNKRICMTCWKLAFCNADCYKVKMTEKRRI